MSETAEPSDFPYTPGFSTSIRAHAPNNNLSVRWGLLDWKWVADSWLSCHKQLDVVLRVPPLEASEPLGQPQGAQMTFVEPIRLTPDRGAQLFTCDIRRDTDPTKTERWVAKIFDPLYYHFYHYNDDNPKKSVWADVAFEADRGYSTEATTYAHLDRKGLTGSIVPFYGGSWTFDIPVARTEGNEIATCVLEGRASSCRGERCARCLPPDGRTLTRSVRMILIEHLHGKTMRRLLDEIRDGSLEEAVDDQTRSEVMAQMLHGEGELMTANTEAGDTAPRNIMVCTSKDTATTHPQQPARQLSCPACRRCLRRVVWFDFDRAEIHTRPGSPKAKVFDKPLNPMNCYYWYPEWIGGDFEGWWPEWYTNDKLRHQWLEEQFGGERAVEYQKRKLLPRSC